MRAHRSLRLTVVPVVAGAVIALAAIGTAAESKPPASRPQPFPQAQKDGCQRSVGALVAGDTPAWVYVHKDRRAKMAIGTVHNSHFFGDDLSTNHLGYDYNVDIVPDAAYENFVGGDPDKKTGNFAGGESGSSQERAGTLHTEWENEAMPTFFVPSEGDRVQVWGGWVWDCAHWNSDFSDNGAADPGEKTEFHPIRAMVTFRKSRFGGAHGETQADAFISSDGTRAHASAECALKHSPVNGDRYDPGYKTCMENPANARQPVNDMNYTFFVPAPPKPSSASKLTYRLASRVKGGPPQVVKRKSNGIQVTVKFKGFGGSHARLRYGRSFFVGWKNARRKGHHLQVQLGTLTVKHSLDPNPDAANSQQSKPPGEYVMFLEVNGSWFRLNKLFPSLLSVSDGQSFKLKKTVDLFLPSKKKLRVYGQGWECDVAGELLPCPKGRNEKALFNDPIGDKIDTFSAKSAPGKHTLKSPSGDWTLTYRVVKK